MGLEVKFQDAPRLTPSMRIALDDLPLERLTVCIPVSTATHFTDRVTVVPAAELTAGKPGALIGGVRRR